MQDRTIHSTNSWSKALRTTGFVVKSRHPGGNLICKVIGRQGVVCCDRVHVELGTVTTGRAVWSIFSTIHIHSFPRMFVDLKPSGGVVLWAALFAAGCLAEPTGDPGASTPPAVLPQDHVSGDWVFHVSGGPWAGSIALASIAPAHDSLIGWTASEAPSRLWDGSTAPKMQLDGAAGIPLKITDAVEWRWSCLGSDRCRMRYQVAGDTARGEFVMSDSLGFEQGFPVFAVRLRPSVYALPATIKSPVPMPDSLPTILVWLADDPAQDTDFIKRLQARGLRAMLAIPSHFVGTGGRPGWEDLQRDQALGFGFAAHSRKHSSTTLDGVDFVGEVLGSISDLDSMGFHTTQFVEPGNWPETVSFDSAFKFKTWRGSLLRTFVSVFASQAGPAQLAEPVSSGAAFGIGHWTISDGLPDSVIRSLWRQATGRGRFTVFGIHTWKLSAPDALDWFLDSLASAQQGGRVRLLPSLSGPPLNK